MTKLERIQVESEIETAQNEIRAQHNNLESKKIFGFKHYFPYQNKKLLKSVHATDSILNKLEGDS